MGTKNEHERGDGKERESAQQAGGNLGATQKDLNEEDKWQANYGGATMTSREGPPAHTIPWGSIWMGITFPEFGGNLAANFV